MEKIANGSESPCVAGRRQRPVRIFTRVMQLALFTIFLSSCVHERDTVDPDDIQDAEKEVVFRLAVPYVAPLGDTRSIGAEEENTISTVDVLAFRVDGNNEYYDYSVTGYKTSGNTEGASTQSFTVSVRVKDYKQRFVIITNAREKVRQLVGSSDRSDEDKSVMLAGLEVAIGQAGDKWNTTGASDYTALPMWGESAQENITSATTALSGSIPLLRMVAKINVQLDESVDGLTDKFRLKSVRLYNTNTIGRVVPDAATLSEETRNNERYILAVSPTLAPNSTLYEGPLVYDDFSAPGKEDVALRGAIYTFETEAAGSAKMLDATCLVVGGVYGSDSDPTYYRIDFVEEDGESYRPILRNHQYIANITEVKSSGHTTPEEAFASKSLNMTAEILEWDEGGMGNIAFDGQYVLSVSREEFGFSRDERSSDTGDNVLFVFTDYTTSAAGAKSGWYVEKIVDAADGVTEVDWLAVTPEQADASVKQKTVIMLDANNTGAARSANIIFAAGRLRYPVTVDQSTVPDVKLTVFDVETNNTVTEMTFPTIAGTAPRQRVLGVRWVPKDSELVVGNTDISTPGFPSGSGAPVTGNITNENGTVSYTIQPPAFTAAEVTLPDGDPFLEKVSKVDFMVSNGMSYLSESVFLRQIHYDLITDPAAYYLLDGNTYSFSVKSNSAWRIKSVVESSAGTLLNLQSDDNLKAGTTGGYNTSVGEEISFTVADNPRIWGTIEVTFECTDSERYFEEKTITLIFATGKRKLLGMALANSYGYNPVLPGTINRGIDSYTMLTTPVNFGLTAGSTVITEGFEFSGKSLTLSESDDTIRNYLNLNPGADPKDNPDIVVIGYNLYFTESQAQMYLEHLNRGGVLIIFSEVIYNEILMRTIFGDNTITQHGINAAGAVYALPDTDDPVLNGPFGDLRGLQWGEDSSSTSSLFNLPLDEIEVYSVGNNISGSNLYIPSGKTAEQLVTAFRHKTLNLIWAGDGGFLSTYSATSNTAYPCKIDADTKRPIPYTGTGSGFGRGTPKYSVYNSQFFANAIAWGFSQTDGHTAD